jgi:hypothetical protein
MSSTQRYGRMGGLAVIASAYALAHGSIGDVDFQSKVSAASVRPVCGTKPLSDSDLLADAMRMADLRCVASLHCQGIGGADLTIT